MVTATSASRPDQSTTGCYGNTVYKTKAEAVILTLTYKNSLRAFLARVKSQDLYSHQKLNMYINSFSSESGYRHRRWRCQRQRRQWRCRMPQYNH